MQVFITWSGEPEVLLPPPRGTSANQETYSKFVKMARNQFDENNNAIWLQYLHCPDAVCHVANRSRVFKLCNNIVIRCDSRVFSSALLC